MKKISLVPLLTILLLIFFSSSSYSQYQQTEDDYYHKIQKGLIYFQKVYEQVQRYYMEEIDPYEFMKAGIDGMLDKLDPYTVFIEREGEIRLQIITTGKYGGLGMEIGMRNNNVTIISPMDNSPAKKSGIRAGDIIEKIDGQPVSSLSLDKISQKLRGLVGTEVEITIRRPGFNNEITMNIKRKEIIIEDVSYADFIKPGIAYVRLAGFTEKAGPEIENAINKLQEQEEIKAFILDLRGNSGGLLEAAVEVAGIFLAKNTPVVSTIGFREGKQTFTTKGKPILPDIPLAVLIDGGSASASEIVAGCFQDLDRAILIGTDSFGKGLVQKIYPVDKNRNTKLKITTAKYYIPSGRCVQKQDITKDNNVFIKSDVDTFNTTSDQTIFKTSNKRIVYGKGGITPDIIIDNNHANYILTELLRQSMIFNFTVQYQQEHPDIKLNNEINDEIFNSFLLFIKENNFSYQTEGEKELKDFLEIAEEEYISEELIQDAKELLDKLNDNKQKNITKNKDELKNVLLVELAEKYYGNKGKIKYSLINDKQLQTATGVLENETEYKKILAIK